MKNQEKYNEKILKVLTENVLISVNKNTNEPMFCNGINCSECLFSGRCNSDSLREWLQAEYKKPIKLANDTIVILKNIDKRCKWIARDKDEQLFLYTEKPYKSEASECWVSSGVIYSFKFFNSPLFNFIRFEDEEPYNIDILLKLNGVER